MVTVTDEHDEPLENFTVEFVVKSGGGTLSMATERTDVSGRATSRLTLGTAAGEQTVEVSAVDTQPATFKLTAEPGAPSELMLTASPIRGTVGTQLADPIAARLTDRYTNPISGFPVDFVVVSGGGSVAQSSAPTGEDGTASTLITLGTAAGENVAEARVPGIAPASFLIIGDASGAAHIALFSGNGQTDVVGKPLTSPFVVRVRDANNNPTKS